MIDFVGGRNDLGQRHRLRTIGDPNLRFRRGTRCACWGGEVAARLGLRRRRQGLPLMISHHAGSKKPGARYCCWKIYRLRVALPC